MTYSKKTSCLFLIFYFGKTNTIIVKLLNREDAQYTLEGKYKLRNIPLYMIRIRTRTTTEVGKSLLIKAFARTIENFMI